MAPVSARFPSAGRSYTGFPGVIESVAPGSLADEFGLVAGDRSCPSMAVRSSMRSTSSFMPSRSRPSRFERGGMPSEALS